ncbi:MAG TPA: site-specific DNA-methyltransferase, partial [bacterium]|nr:site-specific DNA-methyltransferase [bacterium]
IYSETHTIKGVKENCIRNNHSTVKPISLMKYLLTLIKMPRKDNEKQIILDPFCGSGSTLVAAEQLGINYIGIDQDLDNVLISTARI